MAGLLGRDLLGLVEVAFLGKGVDFLDVDGVGWDLFFGGMILQS